MQPETIKEFHDIINTLETTLCALKWQQKENNNIFCFDAEISVFDAALKRLKECCINQVGCLDE